MMTKNKLNLPFPATPVTCTFKIVNLQLEIHHSIVTTIYIQIFSADATWSGPITFCFRMQRMRPLTVNVGTVSVFLRSSLGDPLTELVPFVKIENQFLDFNIKNLDYLIFEKEILI
ncbi:hypothetical protein T08_1632 [Trichinella sp. T8]|nr:hypothetical protein T08_1632 [Trichinella sp. T8]